jgi:hypothetical protein
MIKSKINAYRFWITPILIILILGMLIFTLICDHVEKDRIVVSIWACVFLFLTVTQLFDTYKLIIIDKTDKKISIKHYITRQVKIYNFTDIDGYVDMIEKPARGRPFRVIYLVQNEKFVQKISGFIYSNIEEMEAGLDTIKYLGRKKYSYFKNIRILFGRKVLND